MTGGFDVFNAMKAAPRAGTQPTPPITITSATVVNNSPNRVIEFVPAAGGFTGTTSVTLTTTDTDGPTTTTFNLTDRRQTVPRVPGEGEAVLISSEEERYGGRQATPRRAAELLPFEWVIMGPSA